MIGREGNTTKAIVNAIVRVLSRFDVIVRHCQNIHLVRRHNRNIVKAIVNFKK